MDKKFIERFDVSEWEVLTPSGYVDIVATHKTIPYATWEIELDNGQTLQGADTHILIDKDDREVFIKDSLFSQVKTESGIATVVEVTNLEDQQNMYDLEVASPDSVYYTSGILSHNTTLTAAYLLWKVLFTDEYSIAILANKADTAREILGRIQLSYEELPYWLQQGVVEWNKGSIVLENRSKIFTGATTASGIRGKSVNCVSGDTEVTIRIDGTVYQTTIDKVNDLIYEKTGSYPKAKYEVKGKSPDLEIVVD